MIFRATTLVAALLTGCAEPNTRAALSMWPLAEGFWWEYEDTASPSGMTRVTVEGRTTEGWLLRGLWSHEAWLSEEPRQLTLSTERPTGYAGVGIVPFYVFRWDQPTWDITRPTGCISDRLAAEQRKACLIVVAAGEFICAPIAVAEPTGVTIFWLGIGVGLVRAEFALPDGKRRVLSLTRYGLDS